MFAEEVRHEAELRIWFDLATVYGPGIVLLYERVLTADPEMFPLAPALPNGRRPPTYSLSTRNECAYCFRLAIPADRLDDQMTIIVNWVQATLLRERLPYSKIEGVTTCIKHYTSGLP